MHDQALIILSQVSSNALFQLMDLEALERKPGKGLCNPILQKTGHRILMYARLGSSLKRCLLPFQDASKSTLILKRTSNMKQDI